MTNNTPYQTLIFDLDDTLIDTKSRIKYALHKIYHTHFKDHAPQEIFEKQFHFHNQHVWKKVSENKITPEVARVLRIEKLAEDLKINSLNTTDVALEFLNIITENTTWLPGVEEVFFNLCKNFTVIIITNGSTEAQRQKAQSLGILDHCREFICPEHFNTAKPDARIFEMALEKTNSHKSQSLFIGDSIEADLVGAHNAQLDFCWINAQKESLPLIYPKPKYELESVKDLISHILSK